jgi:hypothetical protein
MRIELRKRFESKKKESDLQLSHNDLLIIFENEEESRIIDELGQPGTTFTGEVRSSDGYGEHYLLIQPKVVVYEGDQKRKIPI